MRNALVFSFVLAACDSLPKVPCSETVGPLPQGAIAATANEADLALKGPGFLIVQDADGNRYYTRGGSFVYTADGAMLDTTEKYRVLGYEDQTSAALVPLQIAMWSPPHATSAVAVTANLDPNADVPAAFDVTNAAATSNVQVTTALLDFAGAPHDVMFYFRKSAARSWEWHVVNGATQAEIQSGALTFDADGRLFSATQSAENFFAPLGTQQLVSFSFGDPLSDDGSGVMGVTALAGTAPTVPTFAGDGSPSGGVTTIVFDQHGVSTSAFSNGLSKMGAQLALATFDAPQSLELVSKGSLLLLGATSDSGEPSIARPLHSGYASVVSGALETSTATAPVCKASTTATTTTTM